jgi:hypothetical protein
MVDIGAFTSPKGTVRPKVPPLRKLKLSNCVWTANEQVLEMWDFSKLEILGFRSTNKKFCSNFLSTVRPGTMPNLKHFSFLALDYAKVQENIDRMLPNFIGGFKNLHKLSTDCYYSPGNLLYACHRIGHSLQILKLLDGTFSRQINLTCKELADIVNLCPKLRLLVLESNLPELEVSKSTSPFHLPPLISQHFTLYKTLAQFRTLHKITISTRLNSYTAKEAEAKAQEFMDFMLCECPDVCMKMERLHILAWNDERRTLDWKVQMVITWNLC